MMGRRKLRKTKEIDNSKSFKSSIHDVIVGLTKDNTLVEKIFNVKTNKGFSLKAYRCLVERGLFSIRSTYVSNICLNHAKCVIMKNVDDDSVEGIPDLIMGNPSEEVVENNISDNVDWKT